MNKKDNHNFTFQLSNKGRSSNFFLLFIASGVIFSGVGIYLVSREDIQILIALVIVAILYFVIFSKIRPSFVEFVLDEESFQINYYPVSTITRDYHSIEIPFETFHGYTIKESLGGWKKELILTVVSNYELADYPSISISILTKNEVEQIIYILNKISKTAP